MEANSLYKSGITKLPRPPFTKPVHRHMSTYTCMHVNTHTQTNLSHEIYVICIAYQNNLSTAGKALEIKRQMILLLTAIHPKLKS